MAQLLDETQLAAALAERPAWRREDKEIVRECAFKTYLDGASFVARVAATAEDMNHHPDIHLGWRKVTLRVSTHSRGGLTDLDFELARKIDGLADESQATS